MKRIQITIVTYSFCTTRRWRVSIPARTTGIILFATRTLLRIISRLHRARRLRTTTGGFSFVRNRTRRLVDRRRRITGRFWGNRRGRIVSACNKHCQENGQDKNAFKNLHRRPPVTSNKFTRNIEINDFPFYKQTPFVNHCKISFQNCLK